MTPQMVFMLCDSIDRVPHLEVDFNMANKGFISIVVHDLSNEYTEVSSLLEISGRQEKYKEMYEELAKIYYKER